MRPRSRRHPRSSAPAHQRAHRIAPRHPGPRLPRPLAPSPGLPASLGALKSSLPSHRVPARAPRRDRPDASRRTDGPRGVPPCAPYHGRGTAVPRQGSRASPIKVLPPLASRAEPPAATCACRRLPPWPPPSRVPASSCGRATIPTPPPALPKPPEPPNPLPRPQPRQSRECSGSPRPPPPATLPALSPRHPKVEIGPRAPQLHPAPVPGRPAAELHQILAGPPPAGAGGSHCKDSSFPEGQSANRGLFCKEI
jgi:hypothetical protein